MSYKGLGKLIFIDGKINSKEYQRILTEKLLSTIEDAFYDEHCIFQHDRVPVYSSKSTQLWLNNQGLHVLPWPSNSPDLNPIENVWRNIIFMIRSADRLQGTKQELKHFIMASCETYQVETCRKLINSIPDRCKNVLKMNSYPTKY